MESIVTARIDSSIKERATAIMKLHGLTPSAAIQQMFDYVVRYDKLPFSGSVKPSKDEIRKKIEAFDNCHTAHPLEMTDAEIRAARLKERYEPLS